MIRTIILFSAILFFTGCPQDLGVTPNPPSTVMTDAEYAVLAAVVDSTVVGPSDSILVLRDSTTSGLFSQDLDTALSQVLLRLSQDVPALRSETMQDFKAKNLSSTYVRDPLKINSRCVRASSTSRHFPWLEVSRVGLSADGLQAIAYVGHSVAPLAGYGVYLVLARQSGQWRIIGSLGVWIS